MKKYIYCLIVISIIASCSADNNPVISNEAFSTDAESYLNDALDIMQEYSINRYKIDWPKFRDDTFKFVGEAETTRDTYYGIRNALDRLGDNHSFFREPSSLKKDSKVNTDPIGMRLTNQVGFIRVPAFSGTDKQANELALRIQSLIREVDSSSIKGWVVDLRHNTGGNMWPMLTGVGPILGEGLVGQFIDPDDNVSKWYYSNGQSKLNNITMTKVSNPYTLINQKPFVAVLTDGYTASSGEAVTISFIGRDNTKSFGNYTYGVSTANSGFPLSDGATIILTVAYMVDRNGAVYGSKIKPDVLVGGQFKDDPLDNDVVVNEAVAWLDQNIN